MKIKVDCTLFAAGGQFAIVSSAAGKAGVPFSGSYTGSKHAINVSKWYFNNGYHILL